MSLECRPENTATNMGGSIEFYKAIIDSITEHIVVIDQFGMICYVNKSWIEFSRQNGYSSPDSWQNLNYLSVCDVSALAGESCGNEAADGIRDVISGEKSHFYFEYPCHSKTEKRWFMMRVSPLHLDRHKLYVVISHQNITERKLAENEIIHLSRIDGLTGVANRRCFDEFLDEEWRRCGRLGVPLSLIMIDIDHFKLFNDTFGHVAGDECLKKIGAILQMFGKRPGDLSARYGGEEFTIILGNAPLKEAIVIAEEILKTVRHRAISFESSPVSSYVTVSMGVATMLPQQNLAAATLIASADNLLYSAKKNGRNRIET